MVYVAINSDVVDNNYNVKTIVRPQGKGVYEECSLGLEFMVVKPHPVAMIQAPSGVYTINISYLVYKQQCDMSHTLGFRWFITIKPLL